MPSLSSFTGLTVYRVKMFRTILLCLGVCSVIISIFMVQSGIATWYWTGIPALVLHSSIEEGMQTEGGGRFRTSYTVYIPAITYDYQVGSKTYISTTISRPMRYSFRNRLDAEAFIARYPASQQTVAYYNPANPADAVLERMTREHAMSFAPLSLLPFLFAGMLHLAVRGLRS